MDLSLPAPCHRPNDVNACNAKGYLGFAQADLSLAVASPTSVILRVPCCLALCVVKASRNGDRCLIYLLAEIGSRGIFHLL
jgi:hypothetical protein